MFCSVCGAEIHDGDRFCEVCGAKVASDNTLQVHKQQPVQMQSVDSGQDKMANPAPENKKKNKGLIYALVTVSVIAVLAIAVLIYVLNSPARKLVNEIDKGNYQEALELCEDKIEGNKIQEFLAEKFLDNYMDEMGDKFISGKIDFRTRLEKLKAIDSLDLSVMRPEMGEQYADLVDDVVDLYEDNKIDYDTACEYLVEMNGISDSNEFMSEYQEACRELNIDISQTPQTDNTQTDNTQSDNTQSGSLYDDSLSDDEVYYNYII